MFNFLKPFYLSIVKWGGLAAGVVLLLLKVRQSGAQAEQRKQAMATLKGVQTRDKIENNVASISDPDRDRLRKKWER